MQKRLLLIFASVLALASCTEKGIQDKPLLQVDKEQIAAPGAGVESAFAITSNCYWNISATDPSGKAVAWVTLGMDAGQGDMEVSVTVAANVKTEPRTAIVQISTPSSAELTKTITITQEPGEQGSAEGYSFPVIQTIDIDAPVTHKLINASIAGNECIFKDGMVLSRSNPDGSLVFTCPSHTQPSAGDEADRSIHRSIQMDDFVPGESILISCPVKESLSGDLRLMLGARAASFTAAGWFYYWSADGESWNKINIENAVTPGSDAVWNIIYFTISEAEAIPAGGTIWFKLTADPDKVRSKTYVSISNTICICPAKAPLSTVPAMNGDKIAFSTGFDDLADSKAPDVRYPLGLLRSATNSYASNMTSFNSQYVVPAELSAFAAASGCYEKAGCLQVGFYDESVWTRMCCGKYTIKIGERLKQMGVASTDAKITLKVCNMKDFRGFDNLAKVTLASGDENYVLEGLQDGIFTEYSKEFHNLTQDSVIEIYTPKLTDDELAALGRGENAKYLQDYRFFIDDVVVELTTIHEQGSETQNDNEDFSAGGNYNW